MSRPVDIGSLYRALSKVNGRIATKFLVAVVRASARTSNARGGVVRHRCSTLVPLFPTKEPR
jgi:hypothetical protein